MGLKHLLNTNLASFYTDNPLETQFANGGLELTDTNALTPGPSEEGAFGIGIDKIPGNIRFRSIVPNVAADSNVGKWFQKIGIKKQVGALDTLTWSDGLNGAKSDYPLMWNNMDPITEPFKPPLQNTLLFQTSQNLVHSTVDGIRISKFFNPFKFLNPEEVPLPENPNWVDKVSEKLNENFSANYLIFKATQKSLALQSPLINGVERGFNIANLLLTTATQGIGTRFQTAYNAPLTGVTDLKSILKLDRPTYGNITKQNDNILISSLSNKTRYEFPGSRLPGLYVKKITGLSLGSEDKNNITVGGEDSSTLLRYYGGASAPFGAVGFTTITRWEFTNTKDILTDGALIWNAFTDTAANPNLPSSEQTPSIGKTANILSISRYKSFNKENQPGNGNGYGMSEGGPQTYNSLPKDDQLRINFLKSSKRQTDFINSQTDYTLNENYNNANLIKFSIEIINNNVTSTNTIGASEFLYFRAFIDQFQDTYKPKWDGYRYVGRADEFYRYSSFNRDINLGFTIAAFSRKEMTPLYNKINKLVGITAPDYSKAGLMRGNIIRLTVGDYLTSVPGILTGISLTPIFEAGWDINRDNDGNIIQRGGNGYTGQLPMAIKVDGFNFTPIHNFTPTKNAPFINFNRQSNTDLVFSDLVAQANIEDDGRSVNNFDPTKLPDLGAPFDFNNLEGKPTVEFTGEQPQNRTRFSKIKNIVQNIGGANQPPPDPPSAFQQNVVIPSLQNLPLSIFTP